ncbi:MAG: pilus assembly protein TadG-related protein [Hyphomicrobiales bacterium]
MSRKLVARFLSRVTTLVSDEGGTAAVVFAIAVIPILSLTGLAVDYSRSYLARQAMQDAADAAAVAAMKEYDLDDKKLELYADGFFQSNLGTFAAIYDRDLQLKRTDGGLRVEVTSKVRTSLSEIFGLEAFEVNVASEVVAGAGALEIALVLDNTGSMRNSMGELKSAAQNLVNMLKKADKKGEVKIAVVPYVGAVNIGNDAAHLAWMDTEAEAKYHGHSMEGHAVAKKIGCSWPWEGGGGGGTWTDPYSGGGGSDRSSSLGTLGRAFAWVGELVGVGEAQAATPYKHNFTDGCFYWVPEVINHFTLFDLIPNTSWKGCVEARPEPMDVNDTPPTHDNPDSLWVPYFWMDDIDESFIKDKYWFDPVNDYLDDDPFEAGTDQADTNHGHTRSIIKYNNKKADRIDEIPPITKGPNQACPDPILPLTNVEGEVNKTIGNLNYWEGSGTNAAEGLAWGWRVLSPSAPFIEGAPYGDVKKVIVLMTDGMNDAAANPNWEHISDYTSYGFRGAWNSRIPGQTLGDYRTFLDDRLLQACKNVKETGIEIYAITFGVPDAATQKLYETCATEPPYYFKTTTATELKRAFQLIGKDLGDIRLVD